MNRLEGKIVHLLTGKERLEDVSVEELQNVAASQPYFSVAQLLLTKKLQQLHHPGFQQQLEKTALYFPNAHWLRYQLMDDELREPQLEINHSPAENNAEPIIETPEPVAVRVEEHELPIEEVLEINEAPVVPTLSIEDAGIAAEEIANEKRLQVEEPVETVNEPEEIETPNSSEESQQSFHKAAEQEPGTATELNEPEEPETEPVADDSNMRLAEMMQHQAEEFNKPVDETTPLPIITEPYHTIDYFASQGIRLNAQQQQDDKLGKQVKKFTDWLKQMKKIGPAEIQSDPEMENRVQHIAESSNETKDVVTESMAEVLVKQGKLDKAIQLYIKLSFLNPDKSAYFAARIEELKGL
ncbi:MAG: hypothetical protein JWN76_3410 [Chitinophagaceae bacterium]|nr:hypothetical protein [Chitinophagaceae bacterium]